MKQTQKNRANDNCGGIAIGCPNEHVANSIASLGKEFKRMNCSKRNSRSCLVNHRSRPQRVGGFTLIELLVVMAITSILLGLIVIGLGGIKDNATLTESGSDLRNLYLVLLMYTDDNDGRFPKITDLTQVPLKVKEALQPYVNSEEIFWCPDDPEKSKHPAGSYDWRVTRDPKTSLAGVRLDLLRHPNRVIIAGELSQGWHKSNMMNVLFADGRVDLVTMQEWFQNITTPLELL